MWTQAHKRPRVVGTWWAAQPLPWKLWTGLGPAPRRLLSLACLSLGRAGTHPRSFPSPVPRHPSPSSQARLTLHSLALPSLLAFLLHAVPAVPSPPGLKRLSWAARKLGFCLGKASACLLLPSPLGLQFLGSWSSGKCLSHTLPVAQGPGATGSAGGARREGVRDRAIE